MCRCYPLSSRHSLEVHPDFGLSPHIATLHKLRDQIGNSTVMKEPKSSTASIPPSTAEEWQRGGRGFGFVFSVVFLLAAVWPLLAGGGAPSWWALGGGTALFFLAVFRPTLLYPASRVWLWIGRKLHDITSPLILAVIFFGVFCPMGIGRRLVARDPLCLRYDHEARSYWIVRRDTTLRDGTMFRQF